MKKLITYALSFGMVAVLGCRDESLNPVPGWESGVQGYAAFADLPEPAKYASTRPHSLDYAKNFPLKAQDTDAAKVNFKIRWVSLDNVLAVNKVELYVEMLDYYNDADGNPKTAALGKKLIKTISPAAGNRVYSTFNISPTEIYNLYKDATFKYDKVNAVKVFANPANPRPTGQWFNGTEDFVVTWKLYTANDKVFTVWEPSSICGDVTAFTEAASNCKLVFDVK